jgi:transmembrane sensor
MTRDASRDDRNADAVECFLCLVDPDADPGARARWTAWLSASPENRAAYHNVRDTWNRPIPADVWPTHAEILDDTDDGDGVLPPSADGWRHAVENRWRALRSSPVTRSLTVVAGLLLVAVFVGSIWRQWPAGESAQPVAYQTTRGEQRRIALADGSAITLGPLTRLSITENQAGRAAHLEAGQAIFTVTHDPLRPFTVSVQNGAITDIGTTFAVSLEPDRAVVTVVEGAVSVAVPKAGAVELHHDQQLSFSSTLGPVASVNARAQTDWVRGRLAYVDEPLAGVVADLVRYTTRDIVIADGDVAGLRYTGTIDTDSVDQWIAVLARVYPVAIERSGNRLILRSSPRG